MTCEFRHRRRVEFFETDLAGIVHFSNYLRYMEMAEHDFLRSLGYSVNGLIGGRHYGWPRVHASCDYRAPLKFEDPVEVQVLVRSLKSRRIEYVHVLRRGEGDAAPVVAVGRMIAVCAAVEPGGAMRATEIPAELAGRLSEAPAALVEGYLAR